MAETTQIQGQPVQAPGSGQTVAIKASPGQDILLTAAFDQAEIRMEGGSVVFAFANGGQVVLDFTDLGNAEAPNVIMADGSVLDMQEYLAALGEGEVEPAAGPDAGGADSGGVGEYRDDAGNLIDGVDKLGVLDPRDFTSIVVESLDADPLVEEPTVPEEPIPDSSEPIVSVTSGIVDEKGLSDGTSAGDGSNTASGSFSIDAGAAGLGLIEIQDKDGNWIDVTAGGPPVNGANGVLTVSVLDGAYSWSYELLNNLLTHDDTTFDDGDGIGGVDDQQLGEAFSVRVFDGNGGVSPAVLLNVTVNDDVPVVDITSEISSVLTLTNHPADAGYSNSFGYYIKDVNGNPGEGMVIWDNVKNFTEGNITIEGYTPDQIGFFIIPNGNALNANLDSGTEVTFQRLAGGEWQAFAGDPLTALKGQGAHVLFDVADFNKDGMHHVEGNDDPGNLNWEDISGGGDRDYNDVNITAKWTVTQKGSLGEFGADGGRVVIDGQEPNSEGLLVVDGDGVTFTVDPETAEYEIESEFLHSYDTPPPSDSFNFSLVDGDNDKVSADLDFMLQQNNPV